MEWEGWALVLIVVVGGFVLLGHMGVDLAGSVADSLHGFEHLMGRPL